MLHYFSEFAQTQVHQSWPGGLLCEESVCKAGDMGDAGLIPGLEDPLEEETVTHSSLLAWRIPRTEEPGGLQPMGLQSQTRLRQLSMHTLMSIESVTPSSHLILCRPLLLLPSFFPSIRVFSSESALRIRRPKYWSFSFSISPSNEYSRLISFRIDWFDFLAVQGTLKSLLQMICNHN